MNVYEARRELQKYKNYESAIKERRTWLEEKKQESNKLTATLSPEPKGSKKENDSMAEKLVKVLDIEKETEKYIERLETEKVEIYRKVLLVEQPYQDILFNTYIRGNTGNETADIMHYSKPHTDRLKKRAIELYTEIKEVSRN